MRGLDDGSSQGHGGGRGGERSRAWGRSSTRPAGQDLAGCADGDIARSIHHDKSALGGTTCPDAKLRAGGVRRRKAVLYFPVEI